MLESHLSMLSSLKDDFTPDDYVQPHYREAYRLAINALVSGGPDAYREVLKAEQIGDFLSEDERVLITRGTEKAPTEGRHSGEVEGSPTDSQSSSGTYWPTLSDVETPNLELGWPNIMHDRMQTNVDLLFHPPRQDSPTIKEVIRKHIQDAQEVIAVAMDVFTDVDIFREIVDASIRGIPVYVILDHSQFRSFLTMVESQDIHICKLRNMRVRTVKGQNYLCRTGAKFHGSMMQKFLLVDCRTVFFGSYSFMWSYEKINLSMVQVITGHLVASYDEEFRTLYARSIVPPEVAPLDGLPGERRLIGKIDTFERKQHLRHTLNTVYRQTCEKQGFVREPHHLGNIEEQLSDDAQYGQQPVMPQRPYGYAVEDTTNYLKRHSYAGERQEGTYIPPYMRHGVSNWNVAGIRGGGYDAPMRNPLPGGYNDPRHPPRLDRMHRSANMRQSYHGNVKQFVSTQQNMPSFEQMSKMFMRDWRVTSYLNNSDAPIAESHDYLDQYDMPENKPTPHLHSRLRSSVVLTSVIPEQVEINGYTDGSSNSVRCREEYSLPPSAHTRPTSSMKLNQPEPVNYRAMHTDFAFKRRSLQIPDEPKPSGNCSSTRDYLNSYASLGRVRGRMICKDLDTQEQDQFKRHSVADPKSNIIAGNRESSSHMYGVLMKEREERNIGREDMGRGGFPHNNLRQDQRSVSHCDFKGAAESKASTESTWRESASGTSSSTLLELREKDRVRPKGLGSPQFFKNSSRKIKSLLNIPEKKDLSPKNKSRLRHRSEEGSNDTLVDDEELGGDREEKESRGTASSGKSSGSPGRWRSRTKMHGSNRDILNDVERASLPRFSTEGLDQSLAECNIERPQSQLSNTHSMRSGVTARELRPVLESGERRVPNRYDSSNGPEQRSSRHSQQNVPNTSSQASDRQRGLTSSKRDHTDRTNHSDHSSHSCHDNKLGRLFQRVGNLIHKKT